MDGLRRMYRGLRAAEAFAWLRIGGAVIVTLAVVLGPADRGASFAFALGAAAAYAIVYPVFQRRTRQIEALGARQAALLHEALDAEERERARIGARLHDDTLQSLLAAQQDVREACAGSLQSLEFADEALTDSVRALRETVLGLHPASLHERGLELALRVEVDRVARRAKVAVDLRVDPQAVGPHDALLYATARELITNVAEHASASRLTVTLAREPEAIALTVEDDGIGMSVDARCAEALAEGHVGLVSTRQRVAAAGGRLDVRSAPGEGTTARVTVPVRVAQRSAVAGAPDDPARLEALRATGLLDSEPRSGR